MNKTKTIVGITGGIGSGKSTICRVLNKMGYPVFYSDQIGRELLKENDVLKSEIREFFGEDIFEGGEIVRARLGAIVFKDKEKLNHLNSLVHPRIREAFYTWVNNQKSKIVFKESAILFESKDTTCDVVCSVVTHIEERIERVMKRDSVSREDVLSRINHQMSDEERIRLSDYIIDNNSDSLIIPQILKLVSSIEN